MADNMYSPHNWKKFPQEFKRNFLKIEKQLLQFLLRIWNLHPILCIFKKNDHLDSLNISEVIDSEKCSYLNAKKQLFQNTFRQWTCSRVPDTVQICMARPLS